MNHSFCQIIGKDEQQVGIGMFCKIKLKKENIFTLITSYQIINERYIKKNNNQIKISKNNQIENIKIVNTKYMNKQYDLAIIQIETNEIKNISFLEIDEKLYEKEFELCNNNESIYIIQKNDGEIDISVSYGVINYIHKSQIIFSCNMNIQSKFSPIFNLTNNKIIGIYRNNSNFYKKGISFKLILEEFFLYNKYYKNSEINISVQVDKKDVNKKLYFLDNYYYNQDNNLINSHDNLKELNSLNTKIFINNKEYQYNKYYKPEKEGIDIIKIKLEISLTNCNYMFAGCENIIDIKFISFNTKYITNMKYMFYKCKNLKSINLFLFDTKNVVDMSNMFYECNSINSLDLSSFETIHVLNMRNMFYKCINLNNLDLSSFDTKNVIDMNYMFYKCNRLYNLYIYNFNTKNITNTSNIFEGCYNIKNIDLSLFNDEQITDKDERGVSIYVRFEYQNEKNELILSERFRVKLSVENNRFEDFEEARIKIIRECDFKSLEERFNYYMFDRSRRLFLKSSSDISPYIEVINSSNKKKKKKEESKDLIMINIKNFANKICETLYKETLSYSKNKN